MILKILKSYELRTYFLVCFTIVGLVTSRAVMSIGVIAMFANILLQFAIEPKYIKPVIYKFWKNKKLFSLSFLFLVSLIALSYSSNKALGFNFVVNKLPLIVIPFAMSSLNKFTKKSFHFLLSFFVLTIFVSGVFVLSKYIANFDLINISIKEGKSIWVPFNHIRYNIMLVFAFITSIYLFLKVDYSTNFFKFINPTITRYFLGFVSVFFFMLIHFLSVRSGLLVLYISTIVSLLYYIVQTKKYYLFFVGSALIMLMPYVAYHSLESFRNKINYAKYDWEQYQNKNYGSNSDSRRMISYKIGFELAKNSMPLGVGTGSIQNEMNKIYSESYPQILEADRIAPHNQFLFSLIDYGLLGFLALIITLFYPLFSIKNKKQNLYYILFWLIVCTPLLFDISLEMQLGITFFALFSSLILKQISITESNA